MFSPIQCDVPPPSGEPPGEPPDHDPDLGAAAVTSAGPQPGPTTGLGRGKRIAGRPVGRPPEAKRQRRVVTPAHPDGLQDAVPSSGKKFSPACRIFIFL